MDPCELAFRHFRAMATGEMAGADEWLHREYANSMAVEEPPACSERGAIGFVATSAWLRLAFADLMYEPIDVVTQAEVTIAHVWMRGRQSGPFVVFPRGQRPVAFPPTARSFAVRQCHLFRIKDGLHVGHSAVRDDLSMLRQLGHLPPTPPAMARMARFAVSGGARRAVREAIDVSQAAADRLRNDGGH